MSNTFVNWNSRVAIAARIAKHRRHQNADELTAPGDYHLPFVRTEAQTKAAKWLCQVYII
jgi:hypothetical protein